MDRMDKVDFCLDSAKELDEMDYEELDRYKSDMYDFSDIELDEEVYYWKSFWSNCIKC